MIHFYFFCQINHHYGFFGGLLSQWNLFWEQKKFKNRLSPELSKLTLDNAMSSLFQQYF